MKDKKRPSYVMTGIVIVVLFSAVHHFKSAADVLLINYLLNPPFPVLKKHIPQ